MVDLLISDLTDLIAGLNDFNEHAYNRFVEKIKVRSHRPSVRRKRRLTKLDRTLWIPMAFCLQASKEYGQAECDTSERTKNTMDERNDEAYRSSVS